MDLWDLTRLLARRWYVALPLLILSAVGGLLFVRGVEPDYKAIGDLQMIPPRGTATQDPNKPAFNPWLDLGYPSLGNAAVLKVTGDDTALKQLKDAGFSDSVVITMAERSPLLEIEVVATSPQQATATVREVIRRLNEEITAAQTYYHVEPADMITTLTLKDGGHVELVTSKEKRVLVVAAGLGLIITIAGSIAFDAAMRRRTRVHEPVRPMAPAADRMFPTPARSPVLMLPSAGEPVSHNGNGDEPVTKAMTTNPAPPPSATHFQWLDSEENSSAPVSPSVGGTDTTIVLPLQVSTREDRNRRR